MNWFGRAWLATTFALQVGLIGFVWMRPVTTSPLINAWFIGARVLVACAVPNSTAALPTAALASLVVVLRARHALALKSEEYQTLGVRLSSCMHAISVLQTITLALVACALVVRSFKCSSDPGLCVCRVTLGCASSLCRSAGPVLRWICADAKGLREPLLLPLLQLGDLGFAVVAGAVKFQTTSITVNRFALCISITDLLRRREGLTLARTRLGRRTRTRSTRRSASLVARWSSCETLWSPPRTLYTRGPLPRGPYRQ